MSMSKFFVLCVITNKPMHGYEINKAVERITNGCCAPTPGALYPVLREFEEGGYVTYHEETVSGRARKIYAITEKGKEAFDVAAKTWLDMSVCIEQAQMDAAIPTIAASPQFIHIYYPSIYITQKERR